jgi:hypothetical protein
MEGPSMKRALLLFLLATFRRKIGLQNSRLARILI